LTILLSANGFVWVVYYLQFDPTVNVKTLDYVGQSISCEIVIAIENQKINKTVRSLLREFL